MNNEKCEVYVLLRCHSQYEYSEPHGYCGAEPTRSVEGIFWSKDTAEQMQGKLFAEEVERYGDPDDVEPDEYGYEIWEGDIFEIEMHTVS